MPVEPVVNENSTARLTVSFTDFDGAAAIPATATYRIDDIDTGIAIRADTALTPAASIQIVLAPTDNRILGSKRNERREVTVTATYAGSQQVVEKYRYQVQNLRFVS